MSTSSEVVYTVGHSTHTLSAFIDLVLMHGVTAVADVRSKPVSRFNPQFNKDSLGDALAAQGVSYVFLGRELGARSEDRGCYVDGRVQYDRIAQTEAFQCGLDRVVDGSSRHVVALMCAEKEPLECHRTLLVAKALVARGVPVAHILGDGRLERYEDSLVRLLGIVGLPKRHLFKSLDELTGEALALQEKKVAYVDEELAAEARRAHQ